MFIASLLLLALVALLPSFSVSYLLTTRVSDTKSRRLIHSKLKALPELIAPSYNLAAGSAALGVLSGIIGGTKLPGSKIFKGTAVALILFGGFIDYQKNNLRFQFDETNFSLVKADRSKIGENIVVGGENSWKYDSFVNWDFLPSEDFPILVYFKETQTPKEKWVQAPIVVDDLPGQAHFFPVIANVKQLKSSFLKYNCQRVGNEQQSAKVQVPSKLVL